MNTGADALNTRNNFQNANFVFTSTLKIKN